MLTPIARKTGQIKEISEGKNQVRFYSDVPAPGK